LASANCEKKSQRSQLSSILAIKDSAIFPFLEN
jgi:hypothetical protein